MKILLTGAKGLFGVNFLNNFSDKYKILATYNKNKNPYLFPNTDFIKVDIKNSKEFKKIFLDFRPNVLIHAASTGDVDFCQKNKKKAYQINTIATQNIAKICKKNNVKLIYLSSNAIYDGKSGSYSEKSRSKPINYYGYTKLEGEKKIRAENPDFMILRLNTMYGWNLKDERQNPATWIIEKLQKKQKIKIVSDIYNNHLYVFSAVKITNDLISKWKSFDIFNISGANCIDRYEFAQQIAEIFKLDKNLIGSVKNDFFGQIAPRPKNTCFNVEKIKKYLSCKIWTTHEGLSHMKSHKI